MTAIEAPRRISFRNTEELEKMLEAGIRQLDAAMGIPGKQVFAELEARARRRRRGVRSQGSIAR